MPTLYFDDDCGVCSKFARWIHRLRPKVKIIPMHHEDVMQEGIKFLGIDLYWRSFHFSDTIHWTSEGDAIAELAGVFPLGKVWKNVLRVPLINWLALQFLRHFQRVRKVECSTVKN